MTDASMHWNHTIELVRNHQLESPGGCGGQYHGSPRLGGHGNHSP